MSSGKPNNAAGAQYSITVQHMSAVKGTERKTLTHIRLLNYLGNKSLIGRKTDYGPSRGNIRMYVARTIAAHRDCIYTGGMESAHSLNNTRWTSEPRFGALGVANWLLL